MAKPRRPEPKFFLDDAVYARGLDYYSRTWFADIDAGVLAGEKSTNYLESPVAAERIHRHLPEVKLLFMLRNPVDRAFSNYRWSRMNGLETEDFETALALEEERTRTLSEPLRYARPFSYLSRGLYREQLEPYFARFDRGRILCLRYEDIDRSPAALAERLHRFLDVEPRPGDAAGLDRVNAARAAGPPDMPAAVRARLERFYEKPNRELQILLGPGFDAWRSA